jgi:hypothetical protein
MAEDIDGTPVQNKVSDISSLLPGGKFSLPSHGHDYPPAHVFHGRVVTIISPLYPCEPRPWNLWQSALWAAGLVAATWFGGANWA